MAFGSRNSILTLFLIIGIGLSLAAAVAATGLVVSLLGNARINFFESHPFWFSYDMAPYGEVMNAVGTALLFAAGAGAYYFFRIFFKKIGQAEVFFFTLFLFSLVPEALRLLILALQILDISPLVGIILSRIVYGSRIFGLLSLFFGSLYALDLQYQKFEFMIVVMLMFAFFLTFSIPFDSQLLLTNGLFKLSDEQGLFIIYYSLILLLIVNYVISLVRGSGFMVPLGILLLLSGKELLTFTLSPVTLGAGLVICLGGIVFSYKGFEATFSFD